MSLVKFKSKSLSDKLYAEEKKDRAESNIDKSVKKKRKKQATKGRKVKSKRKRK